MLRFEEVMGEVGSFSTVGVTTKLLLEYTIDELAVKFNDADTALAVSYFDNLLSTPAIAKILDNTNLSIQKGQEIVDVMSDSSKIGVGGRRGYVGDDWNDNKLTNRDGAAAVSTELNKIVQQFRPSWNVVSGSDRLAAQNNRLEMWNVNGDATHAVLNISQTHTDGTWQYDFYFGGTSYILYFSFIKTSGGDRYYIISGIQGGTEETVKLYKEVGGTTTLLLDTSYAFLAGYWHCLKVTKQGSNFEVLKCDGSSIGTAVDSEITTCDYFELEGAGGTAEATGDDYYYIDKLLIY